MSSRGNSFVASVVVHGGLLSLALILPLLFPDTIKLKYEVVELALVAPPIRQPENTPPPVQLVAPIVRPVAHSARADVVPLPMPKPKEKIQPKVEAPKPPEPVKRASGFDRVEPAPAPAPKAVVRTGMFSDSAAAGELGASTRTVQTGGFGDPNGLTANGRADKIVNIASLGSFDLPAGGGGGDGGDGRGGRDRSGRAVQMAGFSDAKESGGSGTGSSSRNAGPTETPVEIISKPRPEYTEAARQLRLEGEVLIRVLFRATGEIQIIEVVRSLGHGLDQNAVRAAQQIRFKPATRQNQPVDSTATVHIVFQLAY